MTNKLLKKKTEYTNDDKYCPHCGGELNGHLCGERVKIWCDKCGSNNPMSPPSIKLNLEKPL